MNLHYVDSNGLEHDLQDVSSVNTSELIKTNGGIVNLKDTWGSHAITTVTGENENNIYNYDHATIGTRKGTTITGVKVVGNTTYRGTTYKLYYTSDSTVDANSNWISYQDSMSKKDTSNADIYLIYKQVVKPITIHFVTIDGTPIIDDNGNPITETVDAGNWRTTWQNIPGFTQDIDGYTIASGADGHGIVSGPSSTDYQGTTQLYSGSYGSSISGYIFRFIRYYNNQIQVGDGNPPSPLTTRTVNSVSRTWTVNGDFELYVPVESTAKNLLTTVPFHHVDIYGAKLADDSTWNSANNGSNYVNQWNGASSALNGNNSLQKTGIGTYQKSYIGYFGNSNYDNTNGSTLYNGLSYRYDSNGWHTRVTNAATGSDGKEFYKKDTSDTPVLLTEVYQVYSGKKGLTIHYVDESGNEIQDTTGKAFDSGNTFTASAEIAPSGYAFKGAHLGSYDGTVFTTINYTLNGSGWTTSVKNGDSTVPTDNVVNDVYLVYVQTKDTSKLTIHYVDEDGNAISGQASKAENIPQSVNDTGLTEDYLGYTLNDTNYPVSGYSIVGVRVNSMDGVQTVPGARIIYGVKENGGSTTVTSYYTTQDITNRNLSDKDFIETMTYDTNNTSVFPTYQGVWIKSNDLITDVYLIYRKTISRKFTVNYVYMDSSYNPHNITDNNSAITESFTLTNNGEVKRLNTTTAEESSEELTHSAGSGGLVKTGFTRTDNGSTTNLDYAFARVGSATGFNATSVYVDADGTIYYQTGNSKAGTTNAYINLNPEANSTGIWRGSVGGGRNFTLTQDDSGNFTLNDTQHGDIELNLSSSVPVTTTTSTEHYTATYHGEGEVTTYDVVKLSDEENTYRVTYENFIPSESTSIYEIYVDQNASSDRKIWIEDNVKYTGFLSAGLSSALGQNEAGSAIYEWHRVVTGTAATSSNTTRENTNGVASVAGSDGTISSSNVWKENVSTDPSDPNSSSYRTDNKSVSSKTHGSKPLKIPPLSEAVYLLPFNCDFAVVRNAVRPRQKSL